LRGRGSPHVTPSLVDGVLRTEGKMLHAWGLGRCAHTDSCGVRAGGGQYEFVR
jgi:hypothetical protein